MGTGTVREEAFTVRPEAKPALELVAVAAEPAWGQRGNLRSPSILHTLKVKLKVFASVRIQASLGFGPELLEGKEELPTEPQGQD